MERVNSLMERISTMNISFKAFILDLGNSNWSIKEMFILYNTFLKGKNIFWILKIYMWEEKRTMKTNMILIQWIQMESLICYMAKKKINYQVLE